MRYKIVRADRVIKLEFKVRENLSEGWIPQGGVCTGIECNSTWFYQAMTKASEEQDES